jgi:hypothetical protein
MQRYKLFYKKYRLVGLYLGAPDGRPIYSLSYDEDKRYFMGDFDTLEEALWFKSLKDEEYFNVVKELFCWDIDVATVRDPKGLIETLAFFRSTETIKNLFEQYPITAYYGYHIVTSQQKLILV